MGNSVRYINLARSSFEAGRMRITASVPFSVRGEPAAYDGDGDYVLEVPTGTAHVALARAARDQ